MGSKVDFERFVCNSLQMMGCRVDGNDDDTIKITISDEVAAPGIPRTIERATFDPEIALQNAGITQLNVGQRLVRRIIDLVRLTVFEVNDHRYGRTASIATEQVSLVTLLYHFLVRFSVGSNPATIIEELVPVACDITGARPLSAGEIDDLRVAQFSSSPRTPDEITRDLKRGLQPEVYKKSCDARFSERLAQIRAERQALKDKLMRAEPQKWLEGIEEVSLASSDLVSIVLCYPAYLGGAR